MKTSWNDIALIDRYLDHQLSVHEAHDFAHRLDNDNTFRMNVTAQAQTRQLVKKHYFLQQRARLKLWHERLYNDPARRTMRQAIEALFKH